MEQSYDLRKRDFFGFVKTEKPQFINSNAQGMGYGTWNTRGCVVVHPLVRPEKPKTQNQGRSERRVGSPGMTVKATEAHRRASDSISTDFASCEGKTRP